MFRPFDNQNPIDTSAERTYRYADIHISLDVKYYISDTWNTNHDNIHTNLQITYYIDIGTFL